MAFKMDEIEFCQAVSLRHTNPQDKMFRIEDLETGVVLIGGGTAVETGQIYRLESPETGALVCEGPVTQGVEPPIEWALDIYRRAKQIGTEPEVNISGKSADVPARTVRSLKIARGRIDESAVIELARNPGLSRVKLAKILSCKESTLRDRRRCPLLAAAYARIKAEKNTFRRGNEWEDRSDDAD